MSGYEKDFFEGLKLLGIEGNLLEAITEAHKACFPALEAFGDYHSTGERKVTDKQIEDIVNGLDDFERGIYNDMSTWEKGQFIADTINKSNNVDTAALSNKYKNDKMYEKYKRKFDIMHKHREMVIAGLDKEKKKQLRSDYKKFKDSIYDTDFGGNPIKKRTYFYAYKKNDRTKTYEDLLLFVTDGTVDIESKDWYAILKDKTKENEKNKASTENLIFAIRTNKDSRHKTDKDGNVKKDDNNNPIPESLNVTVNDVERVFDDIKSGKSVLELRAASFGEPQYAKFKNKTVKSGKKEKTVTVIDKDSLAPGFKNFAEANRIFKEIPMSVSTGNYTRINNLSDLEGYRFIHLESPFDRIDHRDGHSFERDAARYNRLKPDWFKRLSEEYKKRYVASGDQPTYLNEIEQDGTEQPEHPEQPQPEQPVTDKETSGKSKVNRAFDKYINIVNRDNLDEDGQMELFDKIAEDENLDENEIEELSDRISFYFDGNNNV